MNLRFYHDFQYWEDLFNAVTHAKFYRFDYRRLGYTEEMLTFCARMINIHVAERATMREIIATPLLIETLYPMYFDFEA